MFKLLLAAAAASLLIAVPAQATMVVRLFLDEIVDKAATAFQGTCTGNRTQLDADTGLIVTYTTFRVDDVLKGHVGATHVIKQIGGTLPDDAREVKVLGVPKFTPGESYVVFLPGVSAAGFSSPIGLAQGRFSIVSDAGVSKVTNGRDFKELTERMPADQLPASAKAHIASGATRMGLEDFKQMVRKRTGASR